MEKKIYIICDRFFDINKKNVSIGGIQTYILNLCDVAQKESLIPVVIQNGNLFQIDYFKGIEIVTVRTSNIPSYRLQNYILWRYYKNNSTSEDILLYATEGMVQRWKKGKTLSIQHGISWDIPKEGKGSRLSNIIGLLKKAKYAIWLSKKISYLDKIVCVDYNFVNWYKTQINYINTEYIVIPNFTRIAKECVLKKSEDDRVRIIFARRFQVYRGTRLFADVIAALLNKYSNLLVTIAGEGPDEPYLHDKLDKWDNVQFTKFSCEESIDMHSDKDIAVVPTVGSEGTSLSLLEAMSAGCAVICTNVGGMTNIVIDNYNGLMVNPEFNQLYKALERLILDSELRKRIAIRGRETVCEAFSYEIWESRWRKVLQTIND